MSEESEKSYYLLGQAIARFDPDLRRLTPGCINNLLSIPSRAAIVLRHVWSEMQSLPACREALEQIDWQSFPASVTASGSFWLGYYHAKAARSDLADEPPQPP